MPNLVWVYRHAMCWWKMTQCHHHVPTHGWMRRRAMCWWKMTQRHHHVPNHGWMCRRAMCWWKITQRHHSRALTLVGCVTMQCVGENDTTPHPHA